MRESLYKIKVIQARARQIETYKRKLNSRKSLNKGGSILANNAINMIKLKRRKKQIRIFAEPKELLELRKIRPKIHSTIRTFRHERMRKHGFF
jgi:hypothetical protein